MRPEYLDLTAGQVAVAAALIAINAAISLALKLGMERRLLVASVRTVAQLSLIGLVLEWVFRVRSWPVVVALATVMAAVAGFAAVKRVSRRYPGIWLNSVVSIWASSWIVAGLAVGGVVRVDPWWEPQYAIPLLGMILGNTLNGISLGLDRLTEELVVRRDRVETLLALGATRWEAARDSVRAAVRTGMIPIVNSMMVVGIVSIPGMMTGQLLAGVDPRSAVEYQIVIMFLIASGTALGTVGVVLLGYRRLFNRRHQFLSHSIRSV
ncbi:MAG TPA: iron export ABC transporter permease subunit FetB [Gemmatimonadota bacterium]|nr:iron export ABC transporter permease subunit FetB [Gemmatimonadota bacterium]